MAEHEVYNPGLDMAETLKWYGNSGIELPPHLADTDLPYPIENQQLIELSPRELGRLFFLFPENARERSILRKIIGQPTEWFIKDQTGEKLNTANQADALSPTSIIPARTNYMHLDLGESKILKADISLYEIPQEMANEKVRKLVSSQGFIHEVGHTIVQPLLYIQNYTLKFPDGKLITGSEAISNFQKLAEQSSPISEYAGTYRDADRKFKKDPENIHIEKTAISEEMCEVITAHLLGSAYCGNDAKGKNPFADRPEMKKFIMEFLEAKLVTNL